MRGITAVAALLAAAAGVFLAASHGSAPLGAVLFQWNPSFLNGTQAAIQRYLFPSLWDGVIVPVLEQPAWLVPALLAIGLALLLAARRRRHG